jgi:large subunit ribosomal protein L35
MPKMKTHSSAKKRFKVTGTGKIKRSAAGVRHLMRKKSTKQKRHLRGLTLVNKADHDRIKRLLIM